MTATELLAAVPVVKGRFLGYFEPGSPEWHEQRRTRVGGSEVAAILGLSTYDSRFSLWHRKAGTVGDPADNPEMRWGRLLEDVICAEFAARHPELDVVLGGSWADDADERVANPDRIIVDRATGRVAVLEAKTSRHDDEWGEEGTDEIPVGYRSQVQHYMDVLGVDVAHVAVLIAGSDFREYVVPYDPIDAEIGRTAAAEFLRTLRDGERPSIDEHAQTYQVLRELHPLIDPIDVELPTELVTTYLEACAAEKAAKSAKTHATSLVADAMGTARRATYLGKAIAQRQAKGDGLPFVVIARNATKE